MKNIAQLLSIFLTFHFFSSCYEIKTLTSLDNEKAKVYNYKLGDKDIKFIPLHNYGTEEYIADFRNTVINSKIDGYKLYYGYISRTFEADSAKKEITLRKHRKIFGNRGQFKVYRKLFNKYPEVCYEDIGFQKTDYNADVNCLQFINAWEQINGEIYLDSMDLQVPLNQNFRKERFYDRKEERKIGLDYRFENLMKILHESKDKKILLVYPNKFQQKIKKALSR